MWCEKCSAGSEKAVFKERCPQCGANEVRGETKWLSKNPLPTKPTRSIRAMKKRENYVAQKQTDKGPVSEDVAQIMKDAQHRD